MNNLKIGEIITEKQERDAIHVAVLPIVAAHSMAPGCHCGVDGGKATTAVESNLGIVDPFLGRNVRKGEQFWLFLYPGSITSLRHDWTHAGLPVTVQAQSAEQNAESPADKAKAWIANYGASIPLSYDELMSAAESYIAYGDYLIHGGRYEGMSLPDEFWTHYETITGKKGDGSFFSCSC